MTACKTVNSPSRPIADVRVDSHNRAETPSGIEAIQLGEAGLLRKATYVFKIPLSVQRYAARVK